MLEEASTSTVGASDWRPGAEVPISGVTTAGLVSEAATSIASTFVAEQSTSSTNTYVGVCGAAITNNDTVSRTVLVSATLTHHFLYGIAAGNVVRGYVLPYGTTPTTSNWVYQHFAISGEDTFEWTHQYQHTLAAGATLELTMFGYSNLFNTPMYFRNANIRLELIKR
jgi:hypothetical protein